MYGKKPAKPSPRKPGGKDDRATIMPVKPKPVRPKPPRKGINPPSNRGRGK
jgi:hypothetical protein